MLIMKKLENEDTRYTNYSSDNPMMFEAVTTEELVRRLLCRYDTQPQFGHVYPLQDVNLAGNSIGLKGFKRCREAF